MAKQFKLAGIPVTPSEYQRLKFVIATEEQAGWKPTKKDIKDLIHSDRHPDPEIQKETAELNRELKRDE